MTGNWPEFAAQFWGSDSGEGKATEVTLLLVIYVGRQKLCEHLH